MRKTIASSTRSISARIAASSTVSASVGGRWLSSIIAAVADR
jgi:hypothetical protein